MKLIRLRRILPFMLISGLWITVSCEHEGVAADQLEQVCFNQQILPIFQNSCATSGCHDAQTAEDDYVFTDYAGIMKAISPGNASKSKAYEAITSSTDLMPPHNPLPLDKRTLIRVWIEQGAQETDCQEQAKRNESKVLSKNSVEHESKH